MNKTAYTTGEKVAEVLGAVLLTAASAFYIYLIAKMSFHIFRFAPVGSLVLSLAAYGVLTVPSVRPDLISKAPEKLRKIRRVCIAVKILLTASLFAARVVLMSTVEFDPFLYWDF